MSSGPVVAPTRDDRFAGWAARFLGGPAGSRVGTPGNPWWSAGRVLVVVAVVTAALAVVRNQHCRAVGWTTPGQFVHTCYSDVAVLHGTLGGTPQGLLGFGEASPDGLAQPALTVYVAALLALLVPRLEGLSERLAGTDPDLAVDAGSRVFFDLYGLVVAGSLVVMVLAVVSLQGRRPWDATLVAVSPVVLLSGLVSFDLLGVALGVLAVAIWARDRPLLAGVVLGCAVAARFHVVVVLLALVLIALRAGRGRSVAVAACAASFTWAALNLPLALLSPTAWTAPARGWWNAEPGYGSALLIPKLLADEDVAGVQALTATQATIVSLVLTLAVLVAVVVWVLACPLAPRLPVVVLVLLVGTLLVSKTVPVQASLWLVPWAALAVPSWRDHLWWWAAEGLYVVGVWQFLVGLTESNRALPAGFYAVLLLGRLAAVGWLGWQAWRRGLRASDDEVRRDADGLDPAAGPLRGAEDKVVVQFT